MHFHLAGALHLNELIFHCSAQSLQNARRKLNYWPNVLRPARRCNETNIDIHTALYITKISKLRIYIMSHVWMLLRAIYSMSYQVINFYWSRPSEMKLERPRRSTLVVPWAQDLYPSQTIATRAQCEDFGFFLLCLDCIYVLCTCGRKEYIAAREDFHSTKVKQQQ